MIQYNLPFFKLMTKLGLSERSLTKKTTLSRGVVRTVLNKGNVTLKSLESISRYFELELQISAVQKEEEKGKIARKVINL